MKARGGLRTRRSGTVKSIEYMRFAARRAAATPSEAPAFRSLDLNQPGTPTRQTIVSLDRWLLCANQAATGAVGALLRGLRPGRILEPDSGGDLLARRRTPRVLRRRRAMIQTLRPEGRVTAWVISTAGCSIAASSGRGQEGSRRPAFVPGDGLPSSSMVRTSRLALADRYRQAEAHGRARRCRRGLAGRVAGSRQRQRRKRRYSRLSTGGRGWLASAWRLAGPGGCHPGIRDRHDPNGNPSLNKGRQRGRIDVLSAAVLAIGAGSRAALPEAEVSYFHIPL